MTVTNPVLTNDQRPTNASIVPDDGNGGSIVIIVIG